MDERKIRVLVVDDEQSVRDFLKRLLSLEAVEIELAVNGHEVVVLSQKKEFDLVFLDVRMPDMDGLQALRELKKNIPNAKYIMMTGYAVSNFLEEAKKEGASDLIKKPFDLNQVLGFIKSCRELVK